MKKIAAALLAFAFILEPAGAEKMRIAILDFRADGVGDDLARRVSELIRSEMINTGYYTVIERSSMDAILAEQAFGQAACTEVSCAVEMGKLLSANKMLTGSIMKIGGRIVITGRIIDVEKGVAEFSQNQAAESEGDLFGAIALFSRNLTLRIQGKEPRLQADPVVSGTDGRDGTVLPPARETEAGEVVAPPEADRITASVNGKYSHLLQVVPCPADRGSYGNFRDWGFWKGTSWCGQKVQAGFWVWVAPHWYIWKNRK